MLDAIRSFFGTSMAPESPEEEVGEQDVRLAACVLLIEIAHADEDFTEDERQHLSSAVRRQYGLDEDEADQLLELAEQARASAVDLWQFTKLIKQNYSLGQKMVLVEVMWGLVYSDGELSSHEESLMRRVCHLLDLAPGYLADVRKRVESGRDESD
ncbi:MAG: TerB family tellurite resistance protein [Gemmatimonadetes bacterium]|nr:TerB family tellurite resistance protein [Gemmatimonadota bacterium]